MSVVNCLRISKCCVPFSTVHYGKSCMVGGSVKLMCQSIMQADVLIMWNCEILSSDVDVLSMYSCEVLSSNVEVL